MRFAEVFLRLGSALVAWMILYAYALWLAVLRVIGCGPDGDEMARVLLGMAPLAVAASFVLRTTRSFIDIHRMLRWLGLPLGLLLLLSLRSVWGIFNRVHLDGLAICSAGSTAIWEQAWVPVQAVALAAIAILIVREMMQSD
jgi:hypothetical protein